MKIIKFRAWNKDKKEMVIVKSIVWRGMDRGFWTINDKNPDVFEIMQFTGFTYKNGKEVYEGDIVKSISEFDTYTRMESKLYGGNVYQVKWIGLGFRLVPEPIFNHVINWENLEIIGNIYEHKHLIDNTDTNL